MNDLLIKAQEFLFARQHAYRMVFNPESKFTEKVLRDLAHFCRAHESTFHADARAHAVAEGRREVWLRIAKNLNLTPEQLWELHGRDIE